MALLYIARWFLSTSGVIEVEGKRYMKVAWEISFSHWKILSLQFEGVSFSEVPEKYMYFFVLKERVRVRGAGRTLYNVEMSQMMFSIRKILKDFCSKILVTVYYTLYIVQFLYNCIKETYLICPSLQEHFENLCSLGS